MAKLGTLHERILDNYIIIQEKQKGDCGLNTTWICEL